MIGNINQDSLIYLSGFVQVNTDRQQIFIQKSIAVLHAIIRQSVKLLTVNLIKSIQLHCLERFVKHIHIDHVRNHDTCICMV